MNYLLNIFSVGPEFVDKVTKRIDPILNDPAGLPNGKGKRTHLRPEDLHQLKTALIEAAGHAAALAAKGPLPNRLRGRGRPPDNALFIFIDDIVRAIEAAGLQPGLRYVAPESLHVRVFRRSAPLIWPGSARAPRRLFERWQHYRHALVRG
jgi:hypothetical protein